MARNGPSGEHVVTCPSCGYGADAAAGAVNFCPGCGKDLRGGAEGARTGPLVPHEIANRYRLLSLLGAGGMGAVYRAEHIRMGKALAVKILRGEFARVPGAAERFLAEARIVSRLSHPHTIAVFDFGEIDEAGSGLYLAMEYVSGSNLATVLRASGPLPEHRVADIGQQILGSLGEAHDAGIVHRDVKPGNVMLMRTRSGEDFVKVLDFGIAKLRDAGADAPAGAAASSASSTCAGAIVGTPSYLAPEQARGGAVDARSDLYAVGCLLYELATGRPPFLAPAPMAVVAAHLHDEPPPLASLRPRASRPLEDVIHRALRKRPEERFASADEMREALAAVRAPTRRRTTPTRRPQLTAGPGLASREDFARLERQVRALRGRRLLAPMAASLVLGAAGLGVWGWADLYAALAMHAPATAARIPASLRPRGPAEGEEREPNDTPADANPIVLPRGADGRPAGAAVVRGHVGGKRSATSGDVDVFRVEIPPLETGKVLVAEWHGERAGEGIRGLDVELALNREGAPEDERRGSAPLVATANRGGPGEPERLVAAIAPGIYYLSVRERHEEAAGPVEKPTDWYVLEVRLGDRDASEELEPNDGPDPLASPHGRYAEWRAAAERNPLAEGTFVRGDTSPDDPDLFAVGTAAGGEGPVLVVAVPDPGLALGARLWRPDAEDVASGDAPDHVRFEEAGDAAPGEVVVLKLGAATPGAPALVELRAAAGRGSYEIAALGAGPASGPAVLARVRGLAGAGRPVEALELAAAFAASVPAAPRRAEVLRAAGEVAERVASQLGPASIAACERASQLLGVAVLEADGGGARYRGAFEASAGAERGADTARGRPRTTGPGGSAGEAEGRASTTRSLLRRRSQQAHEVTE